MPGEGEGKKEMNNGKNTYTGKFQIGDRVRDDTGNEGTITAIKPDKPSHNYAVQLPTTRPIRPIWYSENELWAWPRPEGE